MTPLLALDGVAKRYALPRRGVFGPRPHVLAVGGVSLDIARGEVLGVVGESGSGKSTLARLMLRLEAPTSGRIRFDGADITDLSRSGLKPFRKRMQMVFQDSGASLNPRKTVRRTLSESIALSGYAQAGTDLLAEVGLDAALLGRYPHELSGGQRQRVSIARALAMRPELLVADEPVSSLDVSLQAQVLRLLMDLRDRLSLTMVFISHDLALVHHLCSRVAVMTGGVVVEEGLTADVLHRPRHAYTQRLLESVPRGATVAANAGETTRHDD